MFFMGGGSNVLLVSILGRMRVAERALGGLGGGTRLGLGTAKKRFSWSSFSSLMVLNDSWLLFFDKNMLLGIFSRVSLSLSFFVRCVYFCFMCLCVLPATVCVYCVRA